jgi:hypothetical protein
MNCCKAEKHINRVLTGSSVAWSHEIPVFSRRVSVNFSHFIMCPVTGPGIKARNFFHILNEVINESIQDFIAFPVASIAD